jgi:TAT (twin-arginine translocation) pathway signal sequence
MHRRQFLQSGLGATAALALAGTQTQGVSPENPMSEQDTKEF